MEEQTRQSVHWVVSDRDEKKQIRIRPDGTQKSNLLAASRIVEASLNSKKLYERIRGHFRPIVGSFELLARDERRRIKRGRFASLAGFQEQE